MNLLTTRQAAAALQVSEQRVRALISAGRLKSTLFGGSHAIRQADLAAQNTPVWGRPPAPPQADLAALADRKPGRPRARSKSLR
jgi:excisionase family DNA binding protein